MISMIIITPLERPFLTIKPRGLSDNKLWLKVASFHLTT